MSIGGVVLLPLAGVLADIGWRVPFLVYTVALVLLPAMAFALPDPGRREPTGDRPTSIDDLRKTLAQFPSARSRSSSRSGWSVRSFST